MTAYQTTPAAPSPIDNHNTPSAAETRAERHRETYERQARAARPSLWAKVRPWLVGAAAGLLLGGAAAFGLAYQVMPVQAQYIERVFVDIGGRRAFIVSADVVFDSTPLPPAAQP